MATIQAPVGLFKVMQTLGESKTDTATLCKSAKINPYSLIRPLFRKTEYPGTPPSWFADIRELGLIVPASQLGNYQGEKNISALSCADEYDFGADATYAYAAMKWGYIVPYVNSANYIFALKELAWKRFYPSDDYKNEGWAELQQFDGYIDDAEPQNPVNSIKIEYGQPISCIPQPIHSGYSNADILGGTDANLNVEKHPGGVVNIPAVLAVNDNYTFGMSVYKRKGGEPYRLCEHVIGGSVKSTVEGFNDKYPVFIAQNMKTGMVAAEGEYLVIPWVADKKVKLRDGSKTEIETSGVRYFPFRFDERFESFAKKTIQSRVLYVGTSTISMEYIKSTGDFTLKFRLNINPNWIEYPLTASRFFVRVSYKDGNDTRYIRLCGSPVYDVDQNPPLYAQDLGITTAFQTGQGITPGAGSVTLKNTAGALLFGGCMVTLSAKIGSGRDNVNWDRLAYYSTDDNAYSRLDFLMVYTGFTTPLPIPPSGVLDAV